MGRYRIPADGVKNELVAPEGQQKPPYKPKNRKKPSATEEKTLRTAAKEIDDYLDFAIKNGVKQRTGVGPR